jgi:hypothetical protein
MWLNFQMFLRKSALNLARCRNVSETIVLRASKEFSVKGREGLLFPGNQLRALSDIE